MHVTVALWKPCLWTQVFWSFFVFFFSSLPYPNLLTFTFMYSLHVVYKPCFKVSNFPSPPALFSSRLSFVSPDLRPPSASVFQLLSFPLYCSFFLSAWLLYLSPQCLVFITFSFLQTELLSFFFTFPACVYSPLSCTVLTSAFRAHCLYLASLWNCSGGCPRILLTTVEGCINIACHCLIDHSNARNTEPATRRVSG